jgi:hypothetical protein
MTKGVQFTRDAAKRIVRSVKRTEGFNQSRRQQRPRDEGFAGFWAEITTVHDEDPVRYSWKMLQYDGSGGVEDRSPSVTGDYAYEIQELGGVASGDIFWVRFAGYDSSNNAAYVFAAAPAASTGPLSGCWRLYIDGTGAGTLDSGDWSDVVITHWGQATGGGSDLSIVDIVNEDGAFEPNEHPVEFYDHGADQWFQLSWEDASYSTGRIYVDSADGYKLKWECTDYTDDTIVIYRATARSLTDIGTPFS